MRDLEVWQERGLAQSNFYSIFIQFIDLTDLYLFSRKIYFLKNKSLKFLRLEIDFKITSSNL